MKKSFLKLLRQHRAKDSLRLCGTICEHIFRYTVQPHFEILKHFFRIFVQYGNKFVSYMRQRPSRIVALKEKTMILLLLAVTVCGTFKLYSVESNTSEKQESAENLNPEESKIENVPENRENFSTDSSSENGGNNNQISNDEGKHQEESVPNDSLPPPEEQKPDSTEEEKKQEKKKSKIDKKIDTKKEAEKEEDSSKKTLLPEVTFEDLDLEKNKDFENLKQEDSGNKTIKGAISWGLIIVGIAIIIATAVSGKRVPGNASIKRQNKHDAKSKKRKKYYKNIQRRN